SRTGTGALLARSGTAPEDRGADRPELQVARRVQRPRQPRLPLLQRRPQDLGRPTQDPDCAEIATFPLACGGAVCHAAGGAPSVAALPLTLTLPPAIRPHPIVEAPTGGRGACRGKEGRRGVCA